MYDVIIVGAGPAGSSAAALLAREGQRVLLVDKQHFPRDKVCGDAIGGKSLAILDRLGVTQQLAQGEAVKTWGITFGAPSGDEVSIPFSPRGDAPGFVCRREVFDDLVFRAAENAGAEIWQNSEVTGLLRDGEAVRGVTVSRDGETTEVQAPLVMGADGAYSVVARELGVSQLNEKHYVGAIRAYYEGVSGFNDRNFLEIHFVEEVLPGYFWIFPLPNGGANVGLGMLSSRIKKKEARLKELLDEVVSLPRFAPRFEGARRMGKVRGWGLPLGSKPRPMAGDGWVLLGDAASLIDPFSGEGIGNAVVSAATAAKWTVTAKERGDYSEALLKNYETELLDLLRDELKVSYRMQQIGRWKWLLSFVIRKASRSSELADTISCMFDDMTERSKLASPLFYLRVLAA
ncbi:MAG: geranylgeranyl reductase family protein [Rhodothermales bacterium]|nr:geranylgeranyl reductase family protein [Rhodothermales bacterium]